ncbi:protein of unknown function (plasmid) [Thermococcus nautili]|uniref:hypothetical protein n=1 Tax=Thermococcus nautili TaxID=195522 RepID=UPI0025556A25|nr:hypothetical protein [Thermococcus nautili]CAI1494191.1 protein of unknown function [Thermococcus nautili]
MTVRLKDSPCNKCEFYRAVNGKWECSLTHVSYPHRRGAYKCYSKNLYSPKELVDDIVEFSKKMGMFKVRDIARHFGLSYKKTSLILNGMAEAGVLDVFYASPRQKAKPRFRLSEDYPKHIPRAIKKVENYYPFARSTFQSLRTNKKLKLSQIELKRLEITLLG